MKGKRFFICDDLIDAGHPLLLSNDRFGGNGLVTISLRAAISPFLESAYGFGPGRTCCVIGCPPQGSHPWGMQQGSQAASCGIVIITGGSGFFVQGVRGEPWLHQFLSVPHPLAPITKKEVSAVRIRNFFIIITPWNVVGSSGGRGGVHVFGESMSDRRASASRSRFRARRTAPIPSGLVRCVEEIIKIYNSFSGLQMK
jgi:hypothetical protein